ncbi:MAG TPA: PfkB family carbohydrate kinase [Terracidiphilus sp.]|jgi:sugar/nucleoside kinase (ribokinase family)
MADGIFVGLSTIDVVYGVDEFPAANTKVVARSQEVFVGGPAANAAVTFAELGGEPALATAVGRNSLAAVVLEEFKKHKIQLVELNPDFDGLPALSSVTVDRQGNRNVVSANATRTAIPPAKVDSSLLETARLVMVDGHFIDACQAWAAASKARSKPVVLDGGSWKDGMEELVKSVHTAICSADFLPPGCAGRDEVIAFLKSHGVANVAITDGAEAIQFVSGQSSGTIAVPQLEVVDTMGAGDIFHGAYCFFASTGRGFIESLAEATKVASESCRYAGTREWLKHLPAERP